MSEQTISESSFSAASYYSDSSENFDSSYSSSSTSPLCPLTTIIEPIFNIEIINVHGRSVTITVDSSWTVERLKKDYAQRFGTMWHFWYMMYMGKCLQNPDKLIKYNIKEGSTIYVTCRQAHQYKQPIELYVTDMNDNKVVLIYADLEWTVQRVKKEYAQQRGNEHLTCRLYTKGCAMQDKRTLAEYKLLDEAIIHSILSSISPTSVGVKSLKKAILKKRTCQCL